MNFDNEISLLVEMLTELNRMILAFEAQVKS